MPAPDQANLVAVLLAPAEAAEIVHRLWDAGEAVLPLDPRAPASRLASAIGELRPTHVVDADGRGLARGGVPVAGGVAAVVATSGTMGEPKGVVLTRSGLEASARAVSDALGASADERWLCCLPLHHVAGLAVVARAWATGASLVVHPRFDVEAVSAGALRGPATLVSLVPVMLGRLLDAGAPLRLLHRVLVGGAPVPADLAERAAVSGAQVVTTYGLTETWGGVVHDGHPLAGVDVRLGDGDEIQVRSPMTMAGFRLRPQESAAAFTDDRWLQTGDTGTFDAAGRLRVVDRLRDLVITGGVNVAPAEVEAVLARHAGVADVGVAGAVDPEWGERVVAYVVPLDLAAAPTLDDLRAFAAAYLTPAQLPREVVVIDAVPRTPGGKPVRRLLPSLRPPARR